MSLSHAGNAQPSIDREEHWHPNDDESLPGVKRAVLIDPATGRPAPYTDGKLLVELDPLIRQLIQIFSYPGWYDRTTQNLRIQASSGTINTVTTLTNLTNIGSYSGDYLQKAANNTAWATTVGVRFN